MNQELNLVERIVLSVEKFADQTNNGYIIQKRSYNPTKGGTQMRIILGPWRNLEDYTINDRFEHDILVNFNGTTVESEGTVHVSDAPNIRRLYVNFIEYMNSQEGISLNNSFEDLWVSNPHRYPIAKLI